MKRKATEEHEASALPKRGRISDPAPTSFVEDVDYEPELDDGQSDDGSRYTGTTSTLPASTPLTPLSPAQKWPSDIKTIRCTHPNCNKTFNRPARLAAHLRSHTNERPFKCPHHDCDKDYMEEKHLRQHIKGSHSAEREHVCAHTGCGKQFMTATRLRRHQAVHEGQERFRCRDFPPCDQSFRKHQTLQRHIRSEHLHVAAFQCSHKDSITGAVCGAGFDSAGPLRRHQEREHGEDRYFCDDCVNTITEDGSTKSVGFPTLTLLQAHMKQSHINCMFCGVLCGGREDLELHIESQHTRNDQEDKTTLEERKTVACTWPDCSKTFTKVSNMNIHRRTAHEGERFVCGEFDINMTEDPSVWPQFEGCGESFNAKAGLENHVRYVHLKYERPPTKPAERKGKARGFTVLEELAGGGQKSRRTLPCTFPSCKLKFVHSGELEAHVQGEHAIDQALLDNIGAATGESERMPLEPPTAFGDVMQGMAEWEADYGGTEFWIGGGTISGAPTPGHNEEWLRDEAEMRRLIEPDNLDGLIDPALGL
ncbi:Uu.00g002650.m01.CDS01 [Anthostomella pinea]|uniref:Uu.00g002650.m01.CDS01 n=1 Tax=Anthostomella pinea TaxID=933095 RepID=A0AAI8YIM0_9PEZI|nr:Uu.00g002650.m01.CDS01 [Anthostomella pinea]